MSFTGQNVTLTCAAADLKAGKLPEVEIQGFHSADRLSPLFD